MECQSCTERLADFLLDELPESEAVMVQEHLNLCNGCMKVYKDLKGTGKALEAVPTMRAVQGSPEFERAVRAQAVIELENLVAKLPPEKRLKLEARRAARMSRVIERPQPPVRRAFSISLGLLVLAGLVALTIILVYPQKAPIGERPATGVLKIMAGKVEQFYQRSGEPHTPVQEGKNIFPGDSFLTVENGRARFDLGDGGSIFLGPSSQVTFRVQTPGSENFVIALEKGEIGVQRSKSVVDHTDGERPPQQWEIRTEAGAVLVGPGGHVHIGYKKVAKESKAEVIAFSESAQILSHSMKNLGTLYYGHKTELTPDTAEMTKQALTNSRVPAWRLDLVSEDDLERMVAAKIKIIARGEGTLRAELVYSAQNSDPASQDWIAENAATAPEKSGGAVSLPANTRLQHSIPFSAPLSFYLAASRDNAAETPFAFGALQSAHGGVAVDVAKETSLQIRQEGRTVRHGVVPARGASGKIERLELDINKEASGFAAQLSTSADKTNALPLPKELGSSGKVWLQGLADGVNFDEIKISGTLPADWLRERLSK